MNRKGILFILGFIALLVLPTLADAMPESALKLAAAFGMAAYIVVLIGSIFGAVDTIINNTKKPYHRRRPTLPKLDQAPEPPPGPGKNQLFIGISCRERKQP